MTPVASKASLYPHQREALRLALPELKERGGFYFAHDPGCGKTLTAICACRLLGVRRVLVVTVVAGIGVWEREVEQWWGATTVTLRSGGRRVRRGRLGDGGPVVAITNWEQLRDRFKTEEDGTRRLIGRNAADLRLRLARWGYDALIADEVQNAKSPSAGNTAALEALAARAKYRLWLSGTPAHSPLDWHPQYRLLCPGDPYWQQKYHRYKAKLAIRSPYHPGIEGFREYAKREALDRMAPYTHVATADDMAVPRPVEAPIPFALGRAERRAYDQMERDMLAELPDDRLADAPIVLTKMLRLHQITGGRVTDTEGEIATVGGTKLDVLRSVLETRGHQKVIVACRFRAELDAIQAALTKARRPNLRIDGDATPARRTEVENLFQGTDIPFVLLLQYRAGGVALTLTAARALVFYSFEPSVIAYRQMLGRVWRIGQKATVQIVPLLAEGTVDEDLWDGLRSGLDEVDLARLLVERRRRKAA